MAARDHEHAAGKDATDELRSSFEQLVEDQQTRVAGLVYRLLGWRADVDDVVQDVFFAALRGLRAFRNNAELETWLMRIAVNQCRTHQRRRRLRLREWLGGMRRMRERSEAGRLTESATTGERSERLAAVRAAVRALPERDREVIVLHYLEELSVETISEILQLKRNAVEVRLTRARRKLGTLLKEMEVVRDERGDVQCRKQRDERE